MRGTRWQRTMPVSYTHLDVYKRQTLAEAKRYYAEGHFLKGSMGPKIEAAIEYLEKTPHGQTLITNPENIERALNGETGTWIVNE